MQSCQPHTQRHGSRIGVLPPPAVHQVNRVPFVCVHHKRRRLHAVATKLQVWSCTAPPKQLSATRVTQLCHLQVATLQTDERTDNAGSEWEVEWFDEAAEAAELVRHLPATGNRFPMLHCRVLLGPNSPN